MIKKRIDKHNLIVLLAFIVGGLFRVLFPGNVPFGFDQVQILEQAHAIIEGDLTLIGPRTGSADMFTGPLIYYLAVPIVFLFGDAMTVVVLPLALSLVTGGVLFWTVKRYVGFKESVFAIIIWAFSPFLVNLDRVFWNPNLTILASSLLFFPLLPLMKSRQRLLYVDLIFLFIGAFLAYQAHFAGLLLIVLAFLTALFVKRSPRQILLQIGVIMLGFLMSISSLVIFDLRNNFLNLKGLINLLYSKGDLNIFSILQDVFWNAVIIAESTGKVFAFGNSTVLLITLGVCIFICSMIFLEQNRNVHMAYMWLAIIAMIFALYSGSKPEYYFLIAIPPILFLSTRILTQLNKQALVLVFTMFITTALFTNVSQYSDNKGLTLGNQLQVQSYVETLPVSELVYDMPFGSEAGLEYLLRSVEILETGEKVHFSYPNQLFIRGINQISDIGIWSDRRSDEQNNIMQNGYFVTTDKDVLLLQNLYPKVDQAAEEFKIIHEDRVVGSLAMARDDEDSINWVNQDCGERKEFEKMGWSRVEPNTFIQYYSPYCVRLTIDHDSTITEDDIVIH